MSSTVLKPLSWSELSLFEKDPIKHRELYVENKWQPPTEQMQFGSIIHKAIESRTYPWLEELKKLNYDRKKINIARKILTKIDHKRPKESEVFVRTEYEGIPIIGGYDGFDPENRELDEFKTTGQKWFWTQRSVDSHGQLSFYALIYRLRFHGYFREIRLHAITTDRGNIHTYYTNRGPRDIEEIQQRILRCYRGLLANGLWDKRLTRQARMKSELPKLL